MANRLTREEIEFAKMLIFKIYPNVSLKCWESVGEWRDEYMPFEFHFEGENDCTYIVNTFYFYCKGENHRRWCYRIFKCDNNDNAWWSYVNPNGYKGYKTFDDMPLDELPTEGSE